MKLHTLIYAFAAILLLLGCQTEESPNLVVQKSAPDEEVTQRIGQATEDLTKTNEELTQKVKSLEEEKKKLEEEVQKIESQETSDDKDQKIEQLEAEKKSLIEEIEKLKEQEKIRIQEEKQIEANKKAEEFSQKLATEDHSIQVLIDKMDQIDPETHKILINGYVTHTTVKKDETDSEEEKTSCVVKLMDYPVINETTLSIDGMPALIVHLSNEKYKQEEECENLIDEEISILIEKPTSDPLTAISNEEVTSLEVETYSDYFFIDLVGGKFPSLTHQNVETLPTYKDSEEPTLHLFQQKVIRTETNEKHCKIFFSDAEDAEYSILDYEDENDFDYTQGYLSEIFWISEETCESLVPNLYFISIATRMDAEPKMIKNRHYTFSEEPIPSATPAE